MAFFRKYIMVIVGVSSMTLSFVVSVWLHPKVYGNTSSEFSRVRAGPAIGVSITLFASFVNLESLRIKYKQLNTDSILLSLTSAFVSVGSGVIMADMWRGWRGK